MRGRNRNSKGPTPLTRSYESNGPDVKVRGTAQHIAEKYSQLSRDAQASGDPIAAENYLQHAEHYFRIIAASQEQMRLQYNQFRSEEDGEEAEGEENGNDFSYDRSKQPSMDDPDYGSQPYENRQESRQDNLHDNRQEGRYDNRRERPQREHRERFERQDRMQDNGERQDVASHEGTERTNPRRDRFPRSARNDRQDRGDRYNRPERTAERSEQRSIVERSETPERSERPVVSERPERSERVAAPRPARQPRKPAPVAADDEVAAGLPAFLTNPVRQPAIAKVEPEAPTPSNLFGDDEDEAPKPIRRRRRTRVAEASETDSDSVETSAAK